nr:clathrin coat assembly protein AP180-like [Penaeus vannamei]
MGIAHGIVKVYVVLKDPQQEADMHPTAPNSLRQHSTASDSTRQLFPDSLSDSSDSTRQPPTASDKPPTAPDSLRQHPTAPDSSFPTDARNSRRNIYTFRVVAASLAVSTRAKRRRVRMVQGALASCAAEEVRVQQELPPPQQTDSPLDQVAAEQHQLSVQQLHEIPTGVQNNSQQQIVETQHWPQRRGTSQPKLRRLTQGHSEQHVWPQRNEDVLETPQHTAQGSGHRDPSPQQDPLSGGWSSEGRWLASPTTLSPRPPARPRSPSAAPNGSVQRLRKVLSRQQTRSQVLPPSLAPTKSRENSDDSKGTSDIPGVSEFIGASASTPKVAANTSKDPANTSKGSANTSKGPAYPEVSPDPRKTPSYSRVSLQRPPTVAVRGDITPPTTTPIVPSPLSVAPTASATPKPKTPTAFPNAIAAAPTKTLNRTPTVVYAVTPAGDLVASTPAPSADDLVPESTYHQEIDLDLPEIYTSYLAGAAKTSTGSSNSSSPSPPSAPTSTKAVPVKTSSVPPAAPPAYKDAPISPARVASLRNLSLFGDAPSFATPAPAAPPSLLGLRGAGGLLGLGQAAQPQQQNPGLGGLGYLGLLSGLGGLGLASAPPTAGAPAFPSQQGFGLGLPLGLSNFNLGALGLGDLGLGSLGTISPLPSLEGLGLSSGLPAAGSSYGGSARGLTGLMGLAGTASGANAGLGTVGALGSLSALGLSPGRLRDAQLNLGAAASAGSLPATPLSLDGAPDSALTPAEGVVAPPPPAVPLGGEESR